MTFCCTHDCVTAWYCCQKASVKGCSIPSLRNELVDWGKMRPFTQVWFSTLSQFGALTLSRRREGYLACENLLLLSQRDNLRILSSALTWINCEKRPVTANCVCVVTVRWKAPVFLWSPYGIGQTIIFSCCGLFFLSIFLFFPRLISAAADWMSAILPHMVWL